MAASYALVKKMTEGNDQENARTRYLEFLKAGGSDYPVEILKLAGVDATSSKLADDLLKEFNVLVDEMASILKKQGSMK